VKDKIYVSCVFLTASLYRGISREMDSNYDLVQNLVSAFRPQKCVNVTFKYFIILSTHLILQKLIILKYKIICCITLQLRRLFLKKGSRCYLNILLFITVEMKYLVTIIRKLILLFCESEFSSYLQKLILSYDYSKLVCCPNEDSIKLFLISVHSFWTIVF